MDTDIQSARDGNLKREIAIFSNYLDKSEAAAYLNISKKILSNMMRRRVVAYTRIGHKTVRFLRSNLDEAMKRLETGSRYY